MMDDCQCCLRAARAVIDAMTAYEVKGEGGRYYVVGDGTTRGPYMKLGNALRAAANENWISVPRDDEWLRAIIEKVRGEK